MDSDGNEVVIDLSPVIRVYKDGRVERIFRSPHVPPSPVDSATGVSSKDINISSNLQARIYLPSNITANNNQKLPILVYYHGGGFCVGSTFSFLSERYLNLLTSASNVITLSVEYPLAPEHHLSVIYDDSWTALQWVADHVHENPETEKEPWKFRENLRRWRQCRRGDSLLSKIWVFVNPLAENGVDDPKINPLVEKAPRLAELGCLKMLVCVAEKDELRNLGISYAKAVEKSGKLVEVVDVEGEGHCFQILNPEGDSGKDLINRIANFIKQ
ncbi:hypothetical protein K7X08_032026 [Anisodus acutangulus]|uniref:Alpha/beta hydrolase fold-3 domain-containing protein n=1 Tax=Anisodus acutangulus TaxID=402998 RepID=A0A9Q1MNA2_9SOLA|nr:hypothetical protein K7X08_032026 [Anisodus acutangulus]